MEKSDEIRYKVRDLLAERNINLSEASRRIGKNVAYLQQYIIKRSPRYLGERERKALAKLLDISEQELTDLPLAPQQVEQVISDGIYNKVASVVKIVEDFQNDHHLKIEAEKKAQLIAGLVVKLLSTPVSQQEEVIKFAIDWELNKQVV